MSQKILCTFYIGELLFGVEMGLVQEIIRMAEFTAVPGSPVHMMGLYNLRGSVIPVFVLHKIFRLNEVHKGRLKTGLVLHTQHGDLACLMIDSFHEFVEVPLHKFEPVPSNLGANITMFLNNVHRLGEKIILCMDASRIVEQHSLHNPQESAA